MNEMLSVRGVCKGFPSGEQRLEILVNLDLELPRSEMAAVTGVSGSGKSTLLHLLGGMDKPDGGSIVIHGREITRMRPKELSAFRNETIGFVFQFHHLLPEFTALENVMMPLLLRGRSRDSASPEAEELLAEVGLAERTHHRPGELSGGEQQRVALARALAGKPKLLLADEPTGNLDPHTSEEIGQVLLEMHARHGLTSIIVTHNEKLARICTRSYRLAEGKLEPSRWQANNFDPGTARA